MTATNDELALLEKWKRKLCLQEWRISMNIGEVSRQLFMHRNTVTYHLDKVKRQTGLDPRRFYDLVELVKIAQEVLESETEGV